MKLRAITVDDEPVSLRRLSRLLARDPDVEIVAECRDGPGAVRAVRQHKPEVLFLDVQMPGMDGFEVLRALKGTPMPVVIFVTAHDEFALRAFEARALDYLLKPFGESRVEEALQRARTCIRGDAARDEHLARLVELLSTASPRNGANCLFVKRDDRVIVLQPAEIVWIESDGDYVRIHTATEAHFTRMKLTALERRLAPDGFARIHRCRVVNLSHVKEFRPLSRGISTVVVKGGTRIDASYEYLKRIQDGVPHREGITRGRRASAGFTEA